MLPRGQNSGYGLGSIHLMLAVPSWETPGNWTGGGGGGEVDEGGV